MTEGYSLGLAEPPSRELNFNLCRATAAAFDVGYKDPNLIVPAFLSHMDNCRKRWTAKDPQQQIYSPYFAVVQSSMMGKTRLFFHLAQHDVFVFYICLREAGATGFPHSISILQKALTDPNCNEGYYAAFLLAALAKLKLFQDDGKSSTEWLEQQKQEGWWSSILGTSISLSIQCY